MSGRLYNIGMFVLLMTVTLGAIGLTAVFQLRRAELTLSEVSRYADVHCINRDASRYSITLGGVSYVSDPTTNLMIHYRGENGRPAKFILNFLPGEICSVELYDAPPSN